MMREEKETIVKKKVNKNYYTLIAVVVMVSFIVNYVAVVIPSNVKRLDSINQQNLSFMTQQLDSAVLDFANVFKLDPNDEKRISGYLDEITVDSATINSNRELLIYRGVSWIPKKKKSKNDTIIKQHFQKVANRMANASPFTRVFIAMEGDTIGKKLKRSKVFSKNLEVYEEDSIIGHYKGTGQMSFQNSGNRFYVQKHRILNTDLNLLFAVAVDQNEFTVDSRAIETKDLIYSLLIIALMILIIPIVKPLISSAHERITQMDLVSVTFCLGMVGLTLAIFVSVRYINKSAFNIQKADLIALNSKLNKNISEELGFYGKDVLKTLLSTKDINLKDKFSEFNILTKGDSIPHRDDTKKITRTEIEVAQQLIIDQISLDLSPYLWIKKLDERKQGSGLSSRLNSYFVMDSLGLCPISYSFEGSDFRRSYRNREYFRNIMEENMDCSLTAVFSRETNSFELIYVEKAGTNPKLLRGFGFNPLFPKSVNLPDGTGYMLVDHNGLVLYHSDAKKNLNENILQSSLKHPEVIRLLRGFHEEKHFVFEMKYEGKNSLFYGQKIPLGNAHPVYILVFSQNSFLDEVSVFSFGNGFIYSLAYGLLIIFLVFLYSVLLHRDHFNVFSRQHFYWLFPDISRKQQYIRLFWIRLIALVLSVFAFYHFGVTGLKMAFLTGIQLAFYDFYSINYRLLKNSLFKISSGLLFISLVICLALLYNHCSFWAISQLLVCQIVVLEVYRNRILKQGNKQSLVETLKKGAVIPRNAYNRFFTGVLFYNNIVLPVMLVSSIFISELDNKVNYLVANRPFEKDTITVFNAGIYGRSSMTETPNDNYSNHLLAIPGFDLLVSPSQQMLENLSFSKPSKCSYIDLDHLVCCGGKEYLPFKLPLAIILIGLILFVFLDFYSGRFFFYDLMFELIHKVYPPESHELEQKFGFSFPYGKKVFEALEKGNIPLLPVKNQKEKKSEPLPHSFTELFELDKEGVVSPNDKIELITNTHQIVYEQEYNQIWKGLAEDEKKVLYDFAQDHFSNSKNKKTLIRLMERGLIQSDLISGRLKVMSLHFRLYLIGMKQRDPVFIEQFDQESKTGTFAKWRLPIIIVAASLLILLMYLNPESFNSLMVLGSGFATSMGFLSRIFESFQAVK